MPFSTSNLDSFNAISEDDVNEKYKYIKTQFFSDYKEFDAWMSKELKDMIRDFHTVNGRTDLKMKEQADKIMPRYYDISVFPYSRDKKENQKLKPIRDQIDVVFKTALILLLEKDSNYLRENHIQLVESREELIKYFKKYRNQILTSLDEDRSLSESRKIQELEFLKKFLNYLRIAMPVIPASSNKQLLLKILERLEGSNVHYVTGGGMKPCVVRRWKYIIGEEGGAEAVNRPNRKKKSSAIVNSPVVDTKRQKVANQSENPQHMNKPSNKLTVSRNSDRESNLPKNFSRSSNKYKNKNNKLQVNTRSESDESEENSDGSSESNDTGSSSEDIESSEYSSDEEGEINVSNRKRHSILNSALPPKLLIQPNSPATGSNKIKVDFASNIVPDKPTTVSKDNLMWSLIHAVENEPGWPNDSSPAAPTQPVSIHGIKPVKLLRAHSLFTQDLQT